MVDESEAQAKVRKGETTLEEMKEEVKSAPEPKEKKTQFLEFNNVPKAPADPILSLSIGYKNDKNPKKVNLGIGAYRNKDGQPYVFPVVKKAEKQVVENKSLNKEYAPIDGD